MTIQHGQDTKLSVIMIDEQGNEVAVLTPESARSGEPLSIHDGSRMPVTDHRDAARGDTRMELDRASDGGRSAIAGPQTNESGDTPHRAKSAWEYSEDLDSEHIPRPNIAAVQDHCGALATLEFALLSP